MLFSIPSSLGLAGATISVVIAHPLCSRRPSRGGRFHARLDAIADVDAARARARADAADAAPARGDLCGPLNGLPITITQHFEPEGFRWTVGDPQFAERIATTTSPAVARLIG